MGFLQDCRVIECSATALIGQYVGQTGPKVQEMLDKALGRVLFVDEAYRLTDGKFAKEAIDELVDSVTKEKYAKKLIIILAGYEKDMNRLMSVNSGLTSRFPEVIDFRGLRAQECIDLLLHELKAKKSRLAGAKAKKTVLLDISILESMSEDFSRSLHSMFGQLSLQENWASARDVKTIATEIFNKTIRDKVGVSQGQLRVRPDIVKGELEKMLQERASRSQNVASTLPYFLSPSEPELQSCPTPPTPDINTSQATTCADKRADAMGPTPEDQEPTAVQRPQSAAKNPGLSGAIRDAGVSDEVWEQLQRDKDAEAQRQKDYEDLLKAQRGARDAQREAIMRRLLEEEARKKKQAEAQEKLMRTGLCPAGYHWILQADGYRCAGGSHFVSLDAVSRL